MITTRILAITRSPGRIDLELPLFAFTQADVAICGVHVVDAIRLATYRQKYPLAQHGQR